MSSKFHFTFFLFLLLVFSSCAAKTNKNPDFSLGNQESDGSFSGDKVLNSEYGESGGAKSSAGGNADMEYILEKSFENAPKNEKSKKKLAAASKAYQDMTKALQRADAADAKRYFDIYMKELAEANIEPGLLFLISEDLGVLINNLNGAYEVNFVGTQNYQKLPPIPLDIGDNSLVDRYIDIYSRNGKARIINALSKSGAYRDMILKTFKEFGLPEELFYLPIVESSFSLGDVSRAGAAGLWQIMPHRGRALGLVINYWIDERRDPEKSTIAACVYLKQLFLMLNDWHLALAAYNRGEYGLLRDMKFSNAPDMDSVIKRKAAPRETQNYVPQFIAAVIVGENLKRYGFDNIEYQPPLKYDKVKIDKVIDLKVAAECAGTTLEEIKRLNPALKAWCTPQGYPNFELKIPQGSKEMFLKNIASAKELNPAPEYIRYRIEKGDYLGKIAKTFRTTEAAILGDNPQLKSQKYIQPNQIIIIRPGKGYL